MKKILLFVFFSLISISLFSQQQAHLNINANYERMKSTIGVKYGVGVEFQFAKNWGYEIGLNSRNVLLPVQNINLHYATLPVLFKYYSSIVNVSAGFNVDYYLGWENIANKTSDNFLPKTPLFNYGFIVEVSKDIDLSRRFILEPEISINPMWDSIDKNDGINWGLGLKLKYRLSSR